MRLRTSYRPNQARELDDEVIELADRLAPYEDSAWRAPEPPSAVEPVRPVPTSLVDDRLPRPWRKSPAWQPISLSGEPAARALDAEVALDEEPRPGPAEPTGVELVAGSTILASPPPPEAPETLDAMLAQLVRAEAEALEAALAPPGAVPVEDLGMAAASQARNEPCACASGRKYKRCCGQRPEMSGLSVPPA